jgi:hypothetical protein
MQSSIVLRVSRRAFCVHVRSSSSGAASVQGTERSSARHASASGSGASPSHKQRDLRNNTARVRDLRPPPGRGGTRGVAGPGPGRGPPRTTFAYIGMLAAGHADLVWAAQASLWAPKSPQGCTVLHNMWARPHTQTFLFFRSLQSTHIMVRASSPQQRRAGSHTLHCDMDRLTCMHSTRKVVHHLCRLCAHVIARSPFNWSSAAGLCQIGVRSAARQHRGITFLTHRSPLPNTLHYSWGIQPAAIRRHLHWPARQVCNIPGWRRV